MGLYEGVDGVNKRGLLPIYLTPYVFMLVGWMPKGIQTYLGGGQLKLFPSYIK